MAGWIKVYRDLQDHWLAQDFEKLGWWVDLLLSATHKDTKLLIGGHLIELKKGQLRASSTYLAERWGKAKRTVQKFLDLLESDHMISRESSHKSTIITICNYESYQEVEQTQVAEKVAQEYPIGSQSVAENKNEKNVKEINITTTACAYTCACEEYAQRYEKENNWAEVALMLHTSIEQCQDLFKEFCSVQKHDGKVWNDYQDFRRHWRIWASKRAFEKPKAQVKERPKGKTIKDLGWL